VVVGEPGRLGAVVEVDQRAREPLRIVVVRHVAGAREAREAAPRHRLVRRLPVGDRDDRVALAPDDQRGDLRGERQPRVRAHSLTAGLDDRADRVEERLARARVVK
jgi:hypothetical protein